MFVVQGQAAVLVGKYWSPKTGDFYRTGMAYPADKFGLLRARYAVIRLNSVFRIEAKSKSKIPGHLAQKRLKYGEEL
jgi:hypothetical protein